ncbi:SdpI family protein [Leucobacter luti]|uniref:SdpI family protein n=1 Tax=Leucobacter luti TaxID=340320 RepID=UPI003D069347
MPDSLGPMMVSGACLLIAGLVVVASAAAFRRGTLPRNGTIGIRTRWTMASDEAWDAGHRAGLGRLRLAGIGFTTGGALAALAALLPLFGASEGTATVANLSAIIGAAAWGIAWTLGAGRAANRAAKAMLRGELAPRSQSTGGPAAAPDPDSDPDPQH